jgi:hypothetical protein
MEPVETFKQGAISPDFCGQKNQKRGVDVLLF